MGGGAGEYRMYGSLPGRGYGGGYGGRGYGGRDRGATCPYDNEKLGRRKREAVEEKEQPAAVETGVSPGRSLLLGRIDRQRSETRPSLFVWAKNLGGDIGPANN